MSFLELLKQKKIETLARDADPWLIPLERLRGQIGHDGLEKIQTQRVLDLLEVPQSSRRAGTYRRLTKVMTQLGWSAVPNSATQGTSGVGSPPHIFGAMFQALSGTRYQFVPYRGAAPALQDLVAGQLDFIVADAGTSLEQVRAGAVKALAVTAKSRLTVAPNIPTVDEAGLPGLYASLWLGLWAPARTPKDVIARLNGVVADALGDPSVRSRLADLGQEPFPRQQLTPEALRAFQKAEIDKWWPIIKAANIRGE
jgi:tripartite-type tricarboxylate transporter receptor subunit TctC